MIKKSGRAEVKRPTSKWIVKKISNKPLERRVSTFYPPHPIISPLKCIIISLLCLLTTLLNPPFTFFTVCANSVHCATFAFRLYFLFPTTFFLFFPLILDQQSKLLLSSDAVLYIEQRTKTLFEKLSIKLNLTMDRRNRESVVVFVEWTLEVSDTFELFFLPA